MANHHPAHRPSHHHGQYGRRQRPVMSAAAEQQICKDLHKQQPYRDLVLRNGPADWAQSAHRRGGLRIGRHALGVSTGGEPSYLDRRHWSIRDAKARADFGAGVARRVGARLRLCDEEPLHQVAAGANERRWAADQALLKRRLRAEARDPQTPQARLAILAQDPDPSVRRVVAHNPNTPGGTLTLLANDGDEEVRREVATNPQSPIEALSAVARRPDTPAEILARLAKDKSEIIRQVVACNCTTPPDALASLAADPGEAVRREVAKNPSSPSKILARLTADKRANIRRWAAKNAATPPAAVEALASDPRPSVRSAALVALARAGWGTAELVVGGKPDGAWTPPVETRRRLRVVEGDGEGELAHGITE